MRPLLAERGHDVGGGDDLAQERNGVEREPFVVSGAAAAFVRRAGDVGELAEPGAPEDHFGVMAVGTDSLPFDGVEDPLLVPGARRNGDSTEVVHRPRSPQERALFRLEACRAPRGLGER